MGTLFFHSPIRLFSDCSRIGQQEKESYSNPKVSTLAGLIQPC